LGCFFFPPDATTAIATNFKIEILQKKKKKKKIKRKKKKKTKTYPQ